MTAGWPTLPLRITSRISSVGAPSFSPAFRREGGSEDWWFLLNLLPFGIDSSVLARRQDETVSPTLSATVADKGGAPSRAKEDSGDLAPLTPGSSRRRALSGKLQEGRELLQAEIRKPRRSPAGDCLRQRPRRCEPAAPEFRQPPTRSPSWFAGTPPLDTSTNRNGQPCAASLPQALRGREANRRRQGKVLPSEGKVSTGCPPCWPVEAYAGRRPPFDCVPAGACEAPVLEEDLRFEPAGSPPDRS